MRWLLCLALACVGGFAAAQPKPLSRIAFGSCADQNKPCPMWDTVVAAKPDLTILLGDNIYADIEDNKLKPSDPAKIARCYAELGALPAWQKLRAAAPILAMWDDHDYGNNDAGVEWEHKDAAQKLMLDFFGVPADSPRRSRKGVYHAEVFGPPGKRVQVILLDTRYHRSKIGKADRPLPGTRIVPYLPNTDADATMLGAEQWAWLAEQLKVPAEVRLIGSGIQVITDDHPFEKWANMPGERAKLLQTIRDTNANGVVFVSGDRHLGELVLDDKSVGYPVYDITSSGLNQGFKGWRPTEPNRHRVAAMPYGDNFGLVLIDWDAAEPTVSLQLRDIAGEVVVKQTFPVKLLTPKGEPMAAAVPAGAVVPAVALKKVGEEVTVQFAVAGGRAVGNRILLNSEKDYRSVENFTVVVNASAKTGPFAGATFDTFKGKTVRATGKVTLFKDAPQIQVDDAARLVIVDEKK